MLFWNERTPLDETLHDTSALEGAPFRAEIHPEPDAQPILPFVGAPAPPSMSTAPAVVNIPRESAWRRAGREILSGVQTLVSAAVYATLIVTFGFQVARVDGLS